MSRALEKNKIIGIIKMYKSGMSNVEIAEILGVSITSVNDYTRFQKFCEEGDIENLRKFAVATNSRSGAVRLVMELNNMPADVLDVPPVVKAEPVEKTATEPPHKESVSESNTLNLVIRLLHEIENVNENLRDLMDAVIPKYAKDITEATIRGTDDIFKKLVSISVDANNNSDMLFRELKVQTGMLDSMKTNLKKGRH